MIIMALPGALGGIVWMLFVTGTTLNVPSLMGAIMAIGVAKVVRTANALDPVSRTLNTEMQIENDDGPLYAGMYAQLRFTLSDDRAPIVVPANAFVFRMEGSQLALTKDSRVQLAKDTSRSRPRHRDGSALGVGR